VSKTIIVTGAGLGIGAATATTAGARGWSVIVNYRSSAEAAEKVAGNIRAAGGKAMALRADVGNEADVVQLFDEAEREFGSVYGLVNNAAVMAGKTRFVDIDLDRWEATMASNVRGVFLCSREAARRMSTRSGGSGGVIVNITSPAAENGAPGLAIDYATSKGAVNTMTIGLSRELARQGIRVNAVSPGIVETDMQSFTPMAEMKARIDMAVPSGRIGKPEEVAEAVCWLLTDAADYVIGTTINVTGGYRGSDYSE